MDKYDKAVEFLAANPNAIAQTWTTPFHMKGGCLFVFVTPTGKAHGDWPGYCGCISTVHDGYDMAVTDELAELLQSDDRIPRSDDIGSWTTRDELDVFAEWQRKLDAMFPGRTDNIPDLLK